MNNKEYTDLVDKEEFPLDPLVPLDAPFVNDAGTIQNLLNCHIGAVAVIHSKKDTVRSNHWHRGSWHYLYILSGEVRYYERNLDGSGLITKNYMPGDMFFTPPNKVHKTEFMSDCVMISLGKESKDHETHEKDIVREEF